MSTRCEDVAAALATGGPIRRWWARRHAARCPRCAAIPRELSQVARALADAPPLTIAQHRLWIEAAGDKIATGPARAWWPRPALAGALVAMIVGAVGAWWTLRPVDLRQGPPDIADVDPSAVRGEALRDVEDLRGGVVALARELDDLGRRAALLDVRKDLDALMVRLGPRVGSGGL